MRTLKAHGKTLLRAHLYMQISTLAQLLYTYSGRENLIRTASKQKALTHAAVIKPQVCLLFTCKQINKIKIHWLRVDLYKCPADREDTYSWWHFVQL